MAVSPPETRGPVYTTELAGFAGAKDRQVLRLNLEVHLPRELVEKNYAVVVIEVDDHPFTFSQT
jgi:hypothetical protein